MSITGDDSELRFRLEVLRLTRLLSDEQFMELKSAIENALHKNSSGSSSGRKVENSSSSQSQSSLINTV
jgi:hypothetical protein